MEVPKPKWMIELEEEEERERLREEELLAKLNGEDDKSVKTNELETDRTNIEETDKDGPH